MIPLPKIVAKLEKRLILRALKNSGGIVNTDAEALGINRTTLSMKIKLYQLVVIRTEKLFQCERCGAWHQFDDIDSCMRARGKGVR